jgi:large subunit ribosomal protein L15
MMRLHNLRPRPGARNPATRLGCGESSGHGKTSGKGHKGQKARSGGSIRLGFEGGQMPLIRRLPKRGFNNAAFHKNYAIVNINDLNEFKAGTVVNEQLLRESKLVRGEIAGIKILGDGELKHALKIEADKVSESAKAKIEKAGGSVALRETRRSQTAATEQDVDQTAKDEKLKKKSTAKARSSAKKKASRK